MVTRKEAELAVQYSSLCCHRDVIYTAHSLVYTKNPRGNPIWSIVLADRGAANSVVQAALSDVSVVQWNLPAEMVEKLLKKGDDRLEAEYHSTNLQGS